MFHKSLPDIALALLLVTAGCDGITEVRSPREHASPELSRAEGSVEEYIFCDDSVGPPVRRDAIEDIWGAAGMMLPAFEPARPQKGFTMSFSAFTYLADGQEYTVAAEAKYTEGIGLYSLNTAVQVGPVEQRYRFDVGVPSLAETAGIYFRESRISGGVYYPLLVVRDFRYRYYPTDTLYDHISPLKPLYIAPLNHDTLTGWPLIPPRRVTGIWGEVKYFDWRASTTDHVWVSILRLRDGKWWNGHAWVDGYTKLRAGMEDNAWWMADVPHGENLTPGDYDLITSAHSARDGWMPHYCTENTIRVTFKADDQGGGS